MTRLMDVSCPIDLVLPTVARVARVDRIRFDRVHNGAGDVLRNVCDTMGFGRGVIAIVRCIDKGGRLLHLMVSSGPYGALTRRRGLTS